MLILSGIVIKLEILYENDFCLVVNKPAGLAVQGGKGVKTSLDKILAEIRTPPPLLVHRLDKDTSGVLLTAKGQETAAKFSAIFGSGRKTVKKYTAVCSGCPQKKEGNIIQEIPVHGTMKNSETRYKVIKRDEETDFSVIELQLGTGRMHQIRRHLAMIGNPILGDDKYGNFKLNKMLRKNGHKRLLLHATRLIIKEFNIDITSPLPLYFLPFYGEPANSANT